MKLPYCIEVICAENGYKHAKMLNDGRVAVIYKFLFTAAILVMTPAGIEHGYEDRWCYHSESDALAALNDWDGEGEPKGWHRHPGTGRRRENADPLKEYVRA